MPQAAQAGVGLRAETRFRAEPIRSLSSPKYLIVRGKLILAFAIFFEQVVSVKVFDRLLH